MLRIILLMLMGLFAINSSSAASTNTIENKTQTKFDKIIYSYVSVFRGFPKPAQTIMLSYDKKVIFTKKHQTHCESIDMYESVVDDNIFAKILNLYRKIDIKNVPAKDYKPPVCGYQNASFSFYSNGIFDGWVSTQRHEYNENLRKLNLIFSKLIEELDFKPFQTNKTMEQQRRGFNNFERIEEQYTATQETTNVNKKGFQNPASFLLWYYLITAEEITDASFSPRMLYKFRCPARRVCNSSRMQLQPVKENMNINSKWQVVKRGETDGRYFRFTAESGESVTLDIGVNFFTHTVKHEYEKWILEE
ncbi:MAG: hypothetical protein ACPG5B_01070 [Chitinophagales bacterium]